MLQVKLPQLHTVDLSRNDRLTDITAEHLSKCAQLQHVKLEATNLTDAAVEHLAKCPLLRIASLAALAAMDAFREVGVQPEERRCLVVRHYFELELEAVVDSSHFSPW